MSTRLLQALGLLTACVLAGCSSGSSSGRATNHAAIADAARKAKAHPSSCPLALDVTGALRRAGATGPAHAATGAGSTPVDGEVATPTSTLPPLQAEQAGATALSVFDGAVVECSYDVPGRAGFEVDVFDTRRGPAAILAAPLLARRSAYSADQVTKALDTINRTGYGRATVLGSPGTSAVVRLRTDDGSSAVLVAYSDPGLPRLGPVAEALADQI